MMHAILMKTVGGRQQYLAVSQPTSRREERKDGKDMGWEHNALFGIVRSRRDQEKAETLLKAHPRTLRQDL